MKLDMGPSFSLVSHTAVMCRAASLRFHIRRRRKNLIYVVTKTFFYVIAHPNWETFGSIVYIIAPNLDLGVLQ